MRLSHISNIFNNISVFNTARIWLYMHVTAFKRDDFRLHVF